MTHELAPIGSADLCPLCDALREIGQGSLLQHQERILHGACRGLRLRFHYVLDQAQKLDARELGRRAVPQDPPYRLDELFLEVRHGAS